MKIVFVDETKNIGCDSFMGVCVAVIDSSKYPALMEEYLSLFVKLGWKPTQEFKGRFLFSKMGDGNISIDKRIEFARNLISLNVGKHNARWHVSFCWNNNGQEDKNRIALAERAMKTALPSRGKKKAKDPVVVFLDFDKNMDDGRWNDSLFDAMRGRGYCVVEGVAKLPYDHRHVGITVVDILAYLAAWHCVAHDQAAAALGGLMEGSPNDKRLAAIRELLGHLKNIKFS